MKQRKDDQVLIWLKNAVMVIDSRDYIILSDEVFNTTLTVTVCVVAGWDCVMQETKAEIYLLRW